MVDYEMTQDGCAAIPRRAFFSIGGNVSLLAGLCALILVLATAHAGSGNLDRVDFGDSNSENAHNFESKGAEMVDYSALPKPKLRVMEVTASANEPGAVKTIDGDMSSRWGAITSPGDKIRIQYELSRAVRLDQLRIKRASPGYRFPTEIFVSRDGDDWEKVLDARSSEHEGDYETFTFDPVSARYVRIVSHRGKGPHGGQNWIYQVRIGDLEWPDAYVRAATYKALGQPGRRLKSRKNVNQPLAGADWMGAWMAFDIKTNPTATNYITLKLWGPDVADGGLSLMLDRSSENAPYRWIDRGTSVCRSLWPKDWAGPGRDQWVYRTYVLPYKEVTRGKRLVRLRLQQTRDAAAPAVYSVFSHTNPHFEPPADEPQGEPFEWGKKVHENAEEVIEAIDEEDLKERIKKHVKNVMERGRGPLMSGRGGKLRSFFGELCNIYNTEWSGYYHDEKIIHRVKEVLDIRAREFHRQGSVDMHSNELRWAGPGRNFAQYYIKLHEGFEKLGVLDEKIRMEKDKPKMTRRQAYAEWFKGEFKKYHKSRRAFTNQTYYGNAGLYYLNCALLKLNPELAVPETQARWYAYEVMGMVPFAPDTEWKGGWGRESMKAGFPVHVVTETGLTREWGYVVGYGEMTRQFAKMAGNIGDPLMKDRAAETVRARVHMRCRATTDGGYRTLGRIGVLGWRGDPYPGGNRYLSKTEVRRLGDPVSVRVAELGIEQQGKKSGYMPGNTVSDYEYYQVLQESLPSDYRLPIEEGKGDYAWADEGNAVYMIRHDEEFIWGGFYLPPAHGINTRSRLRHITPRSDRVVDVKHDARAQHSGEFYKVKASLEEGHKSVVSGRRLVVPSPPPGTEWPSRMFRKGRAWFYQLHYGDYLIGMNTTSKDSYQASVYRLRVPEEHRGKTVTDLVSGRQVDLSRPVVVGPRSTMVLYLDEE